MSGAQTIMCDDSDSTMDTYQEERVSHEEDDLGVIFFM